MRLMSGRVETPHPERKVNRIDVVQIMAAEKDTRYQDKAD
jgi:hypothetical protein